jgi:hypothetical protein
VRASKALAEDKGGEGELFPFEKLMQVTRRHPLPLRDRGNGQITVAKIRYYVGDDRAQPCGTNAAPLGDCVAVSCGADSQRDEIVNVGCDKSLELRRFQRLLFLRDRAGIRNEQLNRLGPRRDHADQSIIDATGEWCNSIAGTRKPRKFVGAGWMKLMLIESRVINIASPSSRTDPGRVTALWYVRSD